MLSIAATRQMREFVIYWIALALAVGVLAAIVLLLRSRYGLALTAIRDSELGARSNGVDVARIKYVVYVAVAFGTAMVGALMFLQKIRISPDTAFSVNDWTAFVIFITVIGGIGRDRGADHRHRGVLPAAADARRPRRDLSLDPWARSPSWSC